MSLSLRTDRLTLKHRRMARCVESKKVWILKVIDNRTSWGRPSPKFLSLHWHQALLQCLKLVLSYKSHSCALLPLCNSCQKLPGKHHWICRRLSMHSTMISKYSVFFVFCLSGFSNERYSVQIPMKLFLQLHYWTTFDRLSIIFIIRLHWWVFQDDTSLSFLVAPKQYISISMQNALLS